MNAPWADALTAAPDGVLLDVEVVPNAPRDAFPSGYNAWRKRLRARLEAPPTEGRANASLQTLVAKFFALPARDVAVVAGATSRQKRLHLRGLTRAHALRRLEGALDGG